MANFNGFPKDTLDFLQALSRNNDREWFARNRQRYEESVLEPSLELIRSLQEPLGKIAPLLRVEARKTGGSLMRIYKDTRFSKDKTPYKTNIGMQFRHQSGKDVHAPGVYLHVEPGESFLGVGTWRPPTDVLKKIREYIAANESHWRKVLENKKFNQTFAIYPDRLKSTPRGYKKEHPMIDELRQQSFIGMTKLTREQLESRELVAIIPRLVSAGRPMMVALCQALDQPW